MWVFCGFHALFTRFAKTSRDYINIHPPVTIPSNIAPHTSYLACAPARSSKLRFYNTTGNSNPPHSSFLENSCSKAVADNRYGYLWA